ncbi:MAG: 16S rRNA (cytosine(1402)-N(4))-methyltransferase RsmH [Planctomycetaceae bacterium]|jgi:16S rRNA (cytosine1402-N4)-methyltransferase|nr:16S rRNA (cytosine(1402)-N(4))-methyltransferase RsmH [Planctomycetaceae bacterium]
MSDEIVPELRHIAVMANEVLRTLAPKPDGVYVDGTLGAGGHSGLIGETILNDVTNVNKSGYVISFDRDAKAVAVAQKRFAGTNVHPYHADYRDIDIALDQLGVQNVDGMLLDLGLSSDQLDDAERGFSFDASGDLDLRFDISEGRPMWEWLGFLTEERIADLIFQYGEERYSRRIARAIVERRENRQPIRKANDLAQLVRRCIPHAPGKTRIDPATRTFQAMRIFVNDELGALEEFLKTAPARLNTGGRMAIISFHSLEDRIVKTAFRENPALNVLTKKPIEASDAEVGRNPRARSAKLRVAEKK